MEIDRLTHGSVVAMFKAHDPRAHDEIEAMYTGDTLERSAVQRLLEYLRSTSARRLQGSQVTSTLTLDVAVVLPSRTGTVRVTLSGEKMIREALVAGPASIGWSSATVMHKRRLRPSVDIHEHRFRVNMKREEEVVDEGELKSARSASAGKALGERKVYRLKRRFSFPSTDDCFKYDITAVRQINHPAPTWTELVSVPERYEVECEFLSSAVARSSAVTLTSSLLKCFGTILKVLDDTDRLMTVSHRNAVLTEFLTMMYPSEKTTWAAQVVAGSVPHKFLPGPKPVTLEFQHLIEHGSNRRRSSSSSSSSGVNACEDTIDGDGKGWVSIVGGIPYTVTEKADGVHRVLFVTVRGRAYTLCVEGVIKVRDTGLSCKPNGRGAASIIDGEYIPGTSSTCPLFAAYDAFYFEGGDVRSLELMGADGKAKAEAKGKPKPQPTRLAACQAVASALAESSNGTDLRVMVKRFMRYEGDMDGLTACVRQVMARRDAKNFPYDVDGVILTPATWPMGAMSPAPQGVVKSDAVAWHATMKWKPPDQNSIDFLVKILPGEIVRRDSVSYRVGHLYVGYTPSRWEPITTLSLLTDGTTPSPLARKAYVERLFGVPGEQTVLHVCHLRVDDSSVDRILCSNGDEVVDSTVVEFTYDISVDGRERPTSFRWVPLRPRPDKTLRYVTSGGEISGAANDIASALSVWNSIQFPITEDIMCGRTEPDVHEDLPVAAYYLNKTRPGDGGMGPMRDFHNWVKSTDLLLRLRGSTTRSLFDIGCGRAGDLHTWRKLGVSRVLGVDLSRQGIVDPENGANMRILEMKRRNGRKGDPFPRIVLLPMDASKPIDAMQIDSMDEVSGDRQVARVVWSLVDAASVKDDRLRRYHGFAGAGGFDIVSCQFAIHYFFSSRAVLRVFASNVARHIRLGGFFVGTCMDAHRVHAALGDKQCIQGVNDKKVIWRIQRLYDRSSFEAAGDCQGNTGLQIKVYVQTIGQTVVESLVDYRLLRMALAEEGLVPPDAEQLNGLGLSPREVLDGTCTFQDSFARMQHGHAHGHGRAGDKDSDKHITSALAMTDDEKAFSFLNRWFIFVKRAPRTKSI